jgi:hypothetical protein
MCDIPEIETIPNKSLCGIVDWRTHEKMNKFLRKVSNDEILCIKQFNFQKEAKPKFSNDIKDIEQHGVSFSYDGVFFIEERLTLTLICDSLRGKGLYWIVTELPKIEKMILDVFNGALPDVKQIKISLI